MLLNHTGDWSVLFPMAVFVEEDRDVDDHILCLGKNVIPLTGTLNGPAKVFCIRQEMPTHCSGWVIFAAYAEKYRTSVV